MAKRKASGITPGAPSPPSAGGGVEGSPPTLAKTATFVSRTSNLASLPLDFEDLAVAILNHLTVTDILRLSMVTKGWRDYVARNDEVFFKDVLVDAFPEGDLLARLVEKNQLNAVAAGGAVAADAAGTNDGDGKAEQAAAPRLTYKGIYLAFLHRFEGVGNGNFSIYGGCGVHWDSTKVNDVQEDGSALAFIARVDNEHCFEMEWHDKAECERHCAEIVERWDDRISVLGCERPRYDRSRWDGMLRLKNPGKSSFLAVAKCDYGGYPSFNLTLHVIDLKKCSAMTLVKDQFCDDVYQSNHDDEPEEFRDDHGFFYHGLVNCGIRVDNYDCTEIALIRRKQDGDIECSGFLLCEGSMEYGVKLPLTYNTELSTFQMFDRNGITFVFTADDHDGKVDDKVSVPSLLRAIMEEHCK